MQLRKLLAVLLAVTVFNLLLSLGIRMGSCVSVSDVVSQAERYEQAAQAAQATVIRRLVGHAKHQEEALQAAHERVQERERAQARQEEALQTTHNRVDLEAARAAEAEHEVLQQKQCVADLHRSQAEREETFNMMLTNEASKSEKLQASLDEMRTETEAVKIKAKQQLESLEARATELERELSEAKQAQERVQAGEADDDSEVTRRHPGIPRAIKLELLDVVFPSGLYDALSSKDCLDGVYYLKTEMWDERPLWKRRDKCDGRSWIIHTPECMAYGCLWSGLGVDGHGQQMRFAYLEDGDLPKEGWTFEEGWTFLSSSIVARVLVTRMEA